MNSQRRLYITNLTIYECIERGDLEYGKILQMKWLVDAIQDRCKVTWSLGKSLTIDEMMIRYKDIILCSPIRQYLPTNSKSGA
jgi:hypothetical protein